MLKMENKVHPWQTKPSIEVLNKRTYSSHYTLVMPVYNQEKIISETLQKLFDSASLQFDLIIILDGCTDGTRLLVYDFLNHKKNIKYENLGEIQVVTNEFPIYETACDNQGFQLAETDYLLELQADIIIDDYGFDKRMLNHMNKHNLSAISGRHVHCFSFIDRFKHIKYPLKSYDFFKNPHHEVVGRYNDKIFEIPEDLNQNYLYIGETVARGPWLLKKSILVKNNFLDQENFFLGNDDHDFHRRVYQRNKIYTAYCPVKIFSREQDGSTRKKRFGVNKKIYDWLALNKRGSFSYKSFMFFYSPYKKVEKIVGK